MSTKFTGTVEYTVDTSSIKSIGLYYWLQSIDPDRNHVERIACKRIAELCQSKGFQEHNSIRGYWKEYLLSEVAQDDDEISLFVYDEAFRLLVTAH